MFVIAKCCDDFSLDYCTDPKQNVSGKQGNNQHIVIETNTRKKTIMFLNNKRKKNRNRI